MNITEASWRLLLAAPADDKYFPVDHTECGTRSRLRHFPCHILPLPFDLLLLEFGRDVTRLG
jgi:hypothetical protein